MHGLSLKFFRAIIILLLTVFITDTVYASSMMTANTVTGQQDAQSVSEKAVHAAHCLSMQDRQTHEESKVHGSSQHCNHCLACFSMIAQGRLDITSVQAISSVIPAFVEIYHAPLRAQPQKPPIV